MPAAGARASAARAARANAALDASSSSGDSDDPSDSGSDSDMSGSGSGSSDWEGALLDVDDAALADFAANVGADASAAAEAHALIAGMALGGEGQRRAPRHLRAVLDADGGDSEDGSESSSDGSSSYDEEDEEQSDEDSSDEEDGGARQVGGSAPSAGWQWHNGGRTMRRGEPGAAAATKKARKAAHKRPAPGEKAAKRKAAITHKRAERAVGRGFDAASVADAMSSFIAAGGDMMALRPAGKFELRVTAALAALHGLRCSVQGSGKKRFAVLRSTPHASPPLPGDARLAALLRGVGAERQERRHHEPRQHEPRSEARSGARPPRSTPQSGSARRAQRMAFVSGGRIGGEDDGEVRAALAEGGGVALEASFVAVQAGPEAMMMAEVVTAAIATPALAQNRGLRRAAEAAAREAAKLARRRGGSGGPRSRHRADAAVEPAAPSYAPHGDFGDFERHTTGFGSRMLGKMGFAGAGAGLGRDGAGRAEPILPTMRGKGLGLGAD